MFGKRDYRCSMIAEIKITRLVSVAFEQPRMPRCVESDPLSELDC